MNEQTALLWARVKELTKEKKLTQEKLASMCNINFRTLQNWISRDITPDAFCIVAIAKALNVSVEYLVTGNLPPEKVSLSKTLKQIQDLIEMLLKDNS